MSHFESNTQSAQPCGCDAGAGYMCKIHKEWTPTTPVMGFNTPVWDKAIGMLGANLPPLTEIRITDPVTGGAKGSKLCELGAVDPLALVEVGKVAGFGGRKYERYNFAKGYRWSLSYDALQRHLMAFWSGEDTDAESGLHHVAHAAWHCLALLTFALRGRGTDDRFPR